MILDLSNLPSPTDWKQGVAGYSTLRDYNLPPTSQRATALAKEDKRNGARIVRIHKMDEYLNTDADWINLQRRIDALQRVGIKVAIEFACARPLNVAHIQRWGRMDLSNVALAAVANERYMDESTYRKWEAVIRDAGYHGPLFNSNASIMCREFPDMAYGDWESAHVYSGHPKVREDGSQEYFFNCSYPDHSNHNADPNDLVRKRPDLPYGVFECGAVYPNPQRGYSNVKQYEKFLSLGATVICAFCYASSARAWEKLPLGVDEWGFKFDPLGMMAFQWLAQKMQGIDAVPFSNGLRAEPALGAVYDTSPTYRVV
jgi:hypothetical protein